MKKQWNGVLVGWTAVAFTAVAQGASPSPTGELRLKGTTFSDFRTGLTRFDLKVKVAGGSAVYLMKGQTLAEPVTALVEDRISFDGVEVTKEMEGARAWSVNEYANRGSLLRYPYDREIEGELELAGVAISGQFRNAALNSGLEMQDLTFGGVQSKGRLDYSSFNGHYRAKKGLQIGANQMRAGSGSAFLFNLDHYLGQNLLETNFEFGGLKIRGTVQYSDTVVSRVVCTTDSEGDQSCSTVETVVARTGNYDWKIERADGRSLEISTDKNRDGADDAEVRALLGWLELVAYDLR